MGTMQGWVTRERLRQEQEQAKIEQARKEGFDDGYLAGKTFQLHAQPQLDREKEQRRVVEAKIEALEELAKEMCEYCKKNLPFTTDPLDTERLFHDNEEGGVWNCWCPEIHARLDRLRKGIA